MHPRQIGTAGTPPTARTDPLLARSCKVFEPATIRSPINWWLAALIVWAFFMNLGGWPLFDVDEGAFSGATTEMLASGNYISTFIYGAPRFDKPILIYWLQALSVNVFGHSEWAFRLPSALASSLWVWVVFAFAKPRLGDAQAILVAAMLCLSLACWGIAHFASADALLNLFLALAFVDMYRYWEHPSPRKLRRVYVWIGFGLLTKGPVAVLVPMASGLLFFSSTGRLQQFIYALVNPWGWALLLLIAAPWYIAIYLQQGQDFVDGFILKHNVARFTDTFEGHGGNIFYYIPVLLLMLLPFTGLFIQLLRKRPLIAIEPLERYCWMTFGFVFVFFSFSGTQLPHYLLYGFSPLLLLLCTQLEHLRSKLLALVPALILPLIFLLLPELLYSAAAQMDNAHQQAMLKTSIDSADLSYRLLTIGAAVATTGLLLLNRITLWQRLVAAGLIQALLLAWAVLPLLAKIQQQPIKDAAVIAAERSAPLVLWKAHLPSFVTYTQRPVQRRAPKSGDVVLTRLQHQSKLAAHEVLFSANGIVLVQML